MRRAEPARPPQGRAVSSGIPGDGRPRACNRGLEASRRPEGPGRDPDKVPEARGPARPQPKRSPPPPQTHAGPVRRQRRVPAVESAAPAPPPARPLPAQRVGGERKKERAAAALRGPPHHAPRRRRRGDPAGDALSRVASVPLPRAPRRPRYLPPPTPTPSARTPPARASPPPRARATPARRSEAQGRFGRTLLPPPPLAVPSLSATRGGQPGRGGTGEAVVPCGLARPLLGTRLLLRGRGAPCWVSDDLQAQLACSAHSSSTLAEPWRGPARYPPLSCPLKAAMAVESVGENQDGEGQDTGPAISWAPWLSSAR